MSGAGIQETARPSFGCHESVLDLQRSLAWKHSTRIPTPLDTLLFIPDISGFTRFVNETEVEHSRHIVAELLELIIDADRLGLTVAEIEGDAVFFYSESAPPEAQAVLEQARRTFVQFHQHLKQYESRRICSCGACVTAHNLTLKFVAHRGAIGFVEVHDSRKPHGPEVILVHRLLKNPVESDEYLLATQSVLETDTAQPYWGSWEAGAANYDALGGVNYCHTSLTPLLGEVVEPPLLRDYPRIPNPVKATTVLSVSPAEVFELASNLSLRNLWNVDAQEIIFEPDRVNRVGTRHQCIVKGQRLDFETIKADFGPNALVVGERMDDPPLVESFAAYWIIAKASEGTRVRVELHYQPGKRVPRLTGFIFRVMARVFIRRTLRLLSRALAARARSKAVQTDPRA
jgi:Protein of unknown function (DUF2652)/Polyketide cyclase / dehydrase and lipid transport